MTAKSACKQPLLKNPLSTDTCKNFIISKYIRNKYLYKGNRDHFLLQIVKEQGMIYAFCIILFPQTFLANYSGISQK